MFDRYSCTWLDRFDETIQTKTFIAKSAGQAAGRALRHSPECWALLLVATPTGTVWKYPRVEPIGFATPKIEPARSRALDLCSLFDCGEINCCDCIYEEFALPKLSLVINPGPEAKATVTLELEP